jgi:hypothetical protein
MIRICLITLSAIMVATMAAPLAEDTASQWFKMPNSAGSSGFLDISAKGNELWAIDDSNAINRFDFSKGAWTAIPSSYPTSYGTPKKIAASPDGYAYMSPDTSMYIQQWQPDTKTWKNLAWWVFPKVNAISKEKAVVIDPSTWYKDCAVAKGCYPDQLNGYSAAIGDSNERWYINKDKKIFRVNMTNDPNVKDPNYLGAHTYIQVDSPPQPNEPESIDVQCPGRVVMTSKCGRVYLWATDKWYQLPNMDNAKIATISCNAIYVVTYDKQALIWNTPPEYACLGSGGTGTGGTFCTTSPV